MILRNFKRFAGLVGPLQTASYVQYAVFKEHYAQRALFLFLVGGENTTNGGSKKVRQALSGRRSVILPSLTPCVDLPHRFRKNAECMTDCLPVY